MADAIGYVYIFLREDGIRKLGWTINLKRRRADWCSLTGVRHEIEAVWETDRQTALMVEHSTHYQLRSLKVKGHSSIELYKLSRARLRKAVEAEFAKLGMKPGARAAGMSVPGFIKARDRARAWKEQQNA